MYIVLIFTIYILNICQQPGLRALLQITLISFKLLLLIIYIESKYRFVVGLLYIIDMPSKEVDYLLPLQQAYLQTLLQQAYYLTYYCYYNRLTQYTFSSDTTSFDIILVDLLFNEGLRLFRLDWSTSSSDFVLLRSTNILRITQIVSLVVSFSLAITLSELVSLSSLTYERNKENRFIQSRDPTRN